MRTLLRNARLVLPPGRGVIGGDLLVEDGIIAGITFSGNAGKESLPAADVIEDCGGDYLAPGLIDLHCHGAMGRDTMEARIGGTDSWDEILRFHVSRGTTLAVLTTVAAPWEEVFPLLAAASSYRGISDAACFAGIHLEGPYFSPAQRGAHRSAMLRLPDEDDAGELIRHSSVIRRITLAPELPGSLDLVRRLVRSGIPVSAGHSDATSEQAALGFEAGITQATHLHNCMSSLQKVGGIRRTGLAEAAMTTPGILCEIIADGSHLPPAVLRLAWLAKGWGELALVSDATAGTGLPEGSAFQLGGLDCRIEEGAAWTGHGENRRLAGSAIGMIDAVRIMTEGAGVPLEESVAMATLVPARALGLQEKTGSLDPGKQADLLRFSEQWRVRDVWCQGRKIAATP